MLTLIDNYDSFTYNLVQLFGTLGHEPRVIRNDQHSVEDIIADKPSAIILSPGPCDPPQAGICLPLITAAAAARLPLLGVCLGHQCITQAFGGHVVRAPIPRHGKISYITHDGTGLFQGIASPIAVTRYHSLIAEEQTFPDCLHVTARSEDGLIMALAHRDLPIFGLQYHPESIATEHGSAMIANFLKLAGA